MTCILYINRIRMVKKEKKNVRRKKNTIYLNNQPKWKLIHPPSVYLLTHLLTHCSARIMLLYPIWSFHTMCASKRVRMISDQLFVTLYTLSIYPAVHKQLIRYHPNPFRGNTLYVYATMFFPFYMLLFKKIMKKKLLQTWA